MRKHYTFNVLVMPYEDGYMAMCKETGIIRQGGTLENAGEALFGAMTTLIKNVMKDERLEPSLSVGLPIKYKFLYYKTLFKIFFLNAMEKLEFQRHTLQDFQGAY